MGRSLLLTLLVAIMSFHSLFAQDERAEANAAIQGFEAANELMTDPQVVVKALYENEGLYRDFSPADEVKSMRSEFVKHFRTSDGTLSAIVGSGPLHYKEDGVWKTMLSHFIDNNTGEYSNYEYAAPYNGHKIYFPKHPGDPSVSVVNGAVYKDWGKPTMVWLDKDKKEIGKVKYNDAAFSNAANEMLVYREVFPNVDALIRNATDSKKFLYHIKNDAVVANKPQGAVYLAFKEEVEATPTKGQWKLNGNKSDEKVFTSIPNNLYRDFSFVDETGRTRLQIDAPQYYDHSTENKYLAQGNTDSVGIYTGSYLIEQKGKGHDIYILVPVSWLEHSRRVYPIVIDPLTNYYPTGDPTYYPATSTVENSGYCAIDWNNGYWGGRTYNRDITYGWTDDDFLGRGNEYWSGHSRYDLSALADNSCIFGVTYYWYRYNGNTCDNPIILKFGRGQTNLDLMNELYCYNKYPEIANCIQYYRGSGLNGTGWHSYAGNTSHIASALSGDQISIGWDYDGGDDHCTFLNAGDDSDYHNVYGMQHSTAKTYVRVDYEGGPPTGFDKVWTGRVNTDWANSSNWCPVGAPSSSHRVLIPNTTNKPTLSGTGYVSCITIYSSGGAQLNITTGTLNVASGTCANYP